MLTTKELIELARRRTLVFIGPTAAGKDTLMNKVAKGAGVPVLVSHTTRPRRPGEIHGVEYWFVDETFFEGLSTIERRTYHVASGDVWHYGLSEKVGREQGVLILDWEGYINFARWRKEQGLPSPVSIFVPITKREARKRQKRRGDYNKDEFERRWISDDQWLTIAAVRSDYVWKEK